MPNTRRRIGPVGTAVRAAGGLGLIYLAGAVDGTPWDVDSYDPLVGFVVLPAITLAVVVLSPANPHHNRASPFPMVDSIPADPGRYPGIRAQSQALCPMDCGT